MTTSSDLFAPGGLTRYGDALRRRTASATDVVGELLQNLARVDPRSNAFTCIADEQARSAARGIDELARGGVDLGPLMGVPVAFKDLYAVDGMPLTAGSRIDIADVAPREGPLVRRVKRAGGIVLGKTRTTEFAFGTYNLSHPTPWNPCDDAVHRMPGGSSSGSAVAQSAGLCPLTFGTDTGGSVRLPAALCGIAGFKASAGLLPIDGIFPLSHTLDSPGWFASSASDLALAFAAITDAPLCKARDIAGLRIGRPAQFFFDDLDPTVGKAIDAALERLAQAGCRIVPLNLPGVTSIDAVFGAFLAAELAAFLGRDRVEREIDNFDPLVRGRIAPGLELSAIQYITIGRQLRDLARAAHAASDAVDVIVTPTSPLTPLPVQEFDTPERAARWTRDALRFTRPGNMFGMCGVSLPIGHLGGGLPVGLQLLAHHGRDAELLAIAMGLEGVLGHAPRVARAKRAA
ncbi:MAG TPA: amidase [Casimicrobiaceae bacterium]|nr:amidase [Casimicrobiaceae bacterium]